jgi:heterodisulfide reductase subunit C2
MSMHSSDVHQPGKGFRPLAAEILEMTGLNTARCYQCGKCSAGCPMAGETRFRPHDVMRLTNLDKKDRLMGDESIWLCLTCETCSARCPNACDPARVIDALREIAARESTGAAPRAVRAFHRAFLDQVRATGRMFELGLIMEYKLRSGELMKDAMAAPGMLRRGKLRLVPQRIRGVREVRRIFKACEAAREKKA